MSSKCMEGRQIDKCLGEKNIETFIGSKSVELILIMCSALVRQSNWEVFIRYDGNIVWICIEYFPLLPLICLFKMSFNKEM